MSDLAQATNQEQQLRERIASVIASVATKAIVHPVWVMGVVSGENANILRSPLDTAPDGEQRIHAYTVTRVAASHKLQGTPIFDPVRAATMPLRLDAEMRFKVKGIHYFQHGGSAGIHSENLFKEELTRLHVALARKPKLDFDYTVLGHDGLQIEAEGFATYGKTLCHAVDCTLTVRLIQTSNPT